MPSAARIEARGTDLPVTGVRETEPAAMGRLSQASALLSRGLLFASGGGVVAITLIILWQVFARYVLNASPSWSEQLALYILVWAVLLAAAAGVREGFHIRITAAQD
ncbi:MAG: TRAP transporter small permease subunit, partial [Parvularcula sp.]|nr:TRAP transporter small permease subunit [Parvularcula sp.]